MLNKEAYLVRAFYSAAGVKQIDELYEKARQGGAREKFEFALDMNNRNSAMFAPSHIEIYRQSLAVFEEAANEGDVDAMNMAVSYYARGIANSTIETTYGKGMTSMVETAHPDYYKAKKWCLKAIAAGSEWASSVLPRLEADIAKLEGKATPDTGPSPS